MRPRPDPDATPCAISSDLGSRAPAGRGLVLLLAASACIDVAPDSSAADISGTYVGQAEVRRVANTNAQASVATYTLRIANRDGFMHGLWTIAGDVAQPTDPWQAVVTGDHSGNWMVLEYHSPVDGQCHLAGAVVSNTYRPEYRCARNWSHAETLCLTKTGSMFNPCRPPSSNEPAGRNYVNVTVGYRYGSTSVNVSCEPASAVCFTARAWVDPHYLWASDSTHMARRVEGILGVEAPACSWCGRAPHMEMIYSAHRNRRLDDLSAGDALTFIELAVSIDSLETSPQLLDPIRGLTISTNQGYHRDRLYEFLNSEYNTGGWTPNYHAVSSWMLDHDDFCAGSHACTFRTVDRSPYFWSDPSRRHLAIASLSITANPMPEVQEGCVDTPIPWGPPMWERPSGHYSAVRTITLRVEPTVYPGNLDGPFDGDGAVLETYYQKLLVYDFCPGQA